MRFALDKRSHTMTNAMTNKRSDDMEAKLAEHKLIELFGKLCKIVGYEEANALYDKAGLNTDIEHDMMDVEEAQRILEDALMSVTA
jgi:hypothetical protein